MARVKYDVRGVEGSRSLLPAGVYNAKIASADVTKPEGKDERIELVLEVIGDKTHNGAKLYEYINLESEAARWKLREFLEAAQVVKNGKEAGTLDTSKLVGTTIGVKTIVRPADEARGFDEQARVRRMFVADGVSANGDEAEDLEDEAEGDESEYEDMSPTELKAELKERGLSTKGKKPVLVSRLIEDDEAEEEEEEDEEDTEEEESEYSWEDISELDKPELRQLIKDEELDVKIKKGMAVEDIREAVANELDIEMEEDEEEEDDDSDDYDEWDLDDLKTELEERSLSTKGSKKVLIGRLRSDDSEEDKPF